MGSLLPFDSGSARTSLAAGPGPGSQALSSQSRLMHLGHRASARHRTSLHCCSSRLLLGSRCPDGTPLCPPGAKRRGGASKVLFPNMPSARLLKQTRAQAVLHATDSRTSSNAVDTAPAGTSRSSATAVDVSVLLNQPEGNLGSSFCFQEHSSERNLQQEDLQLQLEGLHEHHLHRRRASNRNPVAFDTHSGDSPQRPERGSQQSSQQQQPSQHHQLLHVSDWRHTSSMPHVTSDSAFWRHTASHQHVLDMQHMPEQHADSLTLLYKSIDSCTSWTSLRHLVQLHSKDMAPAHVGCALSRVAQLVEDAPPEDAFQQQALQSLLEALSVLALKAAPRMHLPALARGAWALARLQYYDGPLLRAIEHCAAADASRLSAQDASTLLWAFARFSELYGHSVAHDWVPRLLYQSALRTAQLSTVQPRELQTTIHALAHLRYKPDAAWLGAFLDASEACMPQCNARGLSTLVWSLGMLQAGPGLSWWAAFLTRAEASIRDFSNGPPEAFSNTLWGIAALRYMPPHEWMTHFLWAVQRRMNRASLNSLTSIGWALAVLQYRPDPTWKQVYAQYILRAFRASPPPSARAVVSVFWALAKLRMRPPNAWLSSACGATQAQLQQCSGRDLSLLLWSLNKLMFMPSPEWMFDFWAEVQVRQGSLRPADRAAILIAIARFKRRAAGLGFAPDPELTASLAAQLVPQLPVLDTSAFLSTAAAMARLGRSMPTPILAAVLASLTSRMEQHGNSTQGILALPPRWAANLSLAAGLLVRGASLNGASLSAQAAPLLSACVVHARMHLHAYNAVDVLLWLNGLAAARFTSECPADILRAHELRCRSLLATGQLPGGYLRDLHSYYQMLGYEAEYLPEPPPPEPTPHQLRRAQREEAAKEAALLALQKQSRKGGVSGALKQQQQQQQQQQTSATRRPRQPGSMQQSSALQQRRRQGQAVRVAQATAGNLSTGAGASTGTQPSVRLVLQPAPVRPTGQAGAEQQAALTATGVEVSESGLLQGFEATEAVVIALGATAAVTNGAAAHSAATNDGSSAVQDGRLYPVQRKKKKLLKPLSTEPMPIVV